MSSNRTTVDSGALTMAINVLRGAGKDEVADALLATAARVLQRSPALNKLILLQLIEIINDEDIGLNIINMHSTLTVCANVVYAKRTHVIAAAKSFVNAINHKFSCHITVEQLVQCATVGDLVDEIECTIDL